MDTNEIIGNNVKQVRTECGISQEKLAELTDISASSISRLETGQQMVSIERLLRIAKALDVGIDSILGDFMSFQMDMDEETRKIIIMLEKYPNKKKQGIRKILMAMLQELYEPESEFQG